MAIIYLGKPPSKVDSGIELKGHYGVSMSKGVVNSDHLPQRSLKTMYVKVEKDTHHMSK